MENRISTGGLKGQSQLENDTWGKRRRERGFRGTRKDAHKDEGQEGSGSAPRRSTVSLGEGMSMPVNKSRGQFCREHGNGLLANDKSDVR